jgi:hypothetical protein
MLNSPWVPTGRLLYIRKGLEGDPKGFINEYWGGPSPEPGKKRKISG